MLVHTNLSSGEYHLFGAISVELNAVSSFCFRIYEYTCNVRIERYVQITSQTDRSEERLRRAASTSATYRTLRMFSKREEKSRLLFSYQ